MLQCMKSDIINVEDVETHDRVAMNLVRWMEKNKMGTFAVRFRNISGKQCEKQVDDDVQLKFMKSGYMLGIDFLSSGLLAGREA